jgi:hypothetical protein
MTARVIVLCLASILFAVATPLPANESAPSFNGQLGNEQVWETLRRPLPPEGLDFPATPLEEIVQVLRDQYEIEIQFDRPALEDLGIDQTTAVNVSLRNISLQAALRHILSELNLAYVVTNELLLITSREKADATLSLCVYPVRDLSIPNYQPTEADQKLNLPPELIPVAKVLVTTVASDTWSESGKGTATISGMQPGLLVISQSQLAHEKVSEALAAMRRAKQFAQENQPPPNATSKDGTSARDGDSRGAMPILPPRRLRDQGQYSGAEGYGGYGGGTRLGEPAGADAEDGSKAPTRAPDTAAGAGDIFNSPSKPADEAQSEDLFGAPTEKPKKPSAGDPFSP